MIVNEISQRATVNPIARKSASKLRQGAQLRRVDATTYESASHKDSFKSRLRKKSRIAAMRSSSSGCNTVRSGTNRVRNFAAAACVERYRSKVAVSETTVPRGKDLNLSDGDLLGDTYRGRMIGISCVQQGEEVRCIRESSIGAFEER